MLLDKPWKLTGDVAWAVWANGHGKPNRLPGLITTLKRKKTETVVPFIEYVPEE
jgi:hypothetical protein